MSRPAASLLYWSPRVLTIAFAIFLSLFALDVFNENLGLWHILGALSIHLIPAALVGAVLVVAWRHEWVGGVTFALAAGFYGWNVMPRHVDWALTIAVPLLAIAVLFLVNWIERAKLRPTHADLRG
jgi:hypothetical protein